MAPFFSTSNRPWDVKEPLRAYPQYRPASSSLGSGLRWSRTVACHLLSHTTCAMRSCRKQPLSEWRSEAGAAFSVATRDEVQQVYISAAHSAAQCIVRTGPGPDYQYPSMLGKQVRLGSSLLPPRVGSHPPCPQVQSTKKSSSTPPFTVAGRAAPHLAYAERGGGRAHLTATGENKPGKLGAVTGHACVHIALQPSDRACGGSSLDHSA